MKTVCRYAAAQYAYTDGKRDADVNQRLPPDLFHFPLEIGGMGSCRAVGEALLRHLRPFGMTNYLVGAMPHPDHPYPGAFMMGNLPAEWSDNYISGRMGDHDPALHALQLNAGPVSIQDIRKGRAGFQPDAEEISILDAAAELGWPHGLIVPIYGAQGYRGIGCVCGSGPDPDAHARIVLEFLVWHAHDRMRTLFGAEGDVQAVRLSLREREVLNAARRGLSDDEIATAAAISVRTVRFHFENARRKLASRNRTEAIAKALQLQLLGL